MKTLLVLLILALALGGGYWKLRNPNAGLDDLREQATSTVQRFQRGVDVVVDGAEGVPVANGGNVDIAARLSALEAAVADQAGAARMEADTIRQAENDVIETRLEDIGRTAESTQAATENLSATVDALSARIDALDAGYNELASTPTAEPETAAESATFDALTNRVDALDTRLDELASAAPAETEAATDPAPSGLDPNALQARFDELDTRIATLAGSVASQADAADETASARAEADQASIDALQDEVSTRIANLGSAAEGSNDELDIEELTRSLQGTGERIEALGRQAQSLPASDAKNDAVQALQTGLLGEIEELEIRLGESVGEPGTALADGISQVREQINQLASQSAASSGELQAQKSGRSIEYKIYFDLGSTEITAEAATVLDSFVIQEKNRTTGVSIFGLTDRAGPAEYNQLIADRRARSVQSYLIQNGFDYSRITAVTGLGEDAAAQVLDDEQFDRQQRAVVLFAAQP